MTVAISKESLSGAYVRLPLSAFRISSLPPVDIYYESSNHETPMLLSSRSLGISADALDEMEGRGHSFLCVLQCDFKRISNALYQSLQSVILDKTVPSTERFSVLQSAIATEVEIAFRRTDSTRLITMAYQVSSQITQLLTESPIVPQELFDMVQHDACTFVHITNVAAYAVVLAQRLKIDDTQELEKIAVGAMLHDVGKRFVPEEILSKRGRLTPAERQIIETHPSLGYQELCQRKELDHGQLMMVYQHHERVDGSGYPVGIPEDEIHPWAKLLSVVDVFDAMTGKRPYRKAISSSDALLYLAENAKTQFAPEVVLCWLSAFQQN